MELRKNYQPQCRVELEINPDHKDTDKATDQLSDIFMDQILKGAPVSKFFFLHPEVLRVRYYIDDEIRLDAENPREEIERRKFPEDHRDFFKKDLKHSLKKLRDQLASFEDALADIDYVEAEYHIVLTSSWADHGEQGVDLKLKMPLKEAIAHAEKEFMKVNNRSDVQANYYVHMKVGGTHVMLPQKFWIGFIKSYRDAEKEKSEETKT